MDYIKNSLDIIIKLKIDNEIEEFKKNYQNLSEGIEYEKLLQKEEEQIRNISRTELILKIQCEKYAKKIMRLRTRSPEVKYAHIWPETALCAIML